MQGVYARPFKIISVFNVKLHLHFNLQSNSDLANVFIARARDGLACLRIRFSLDEFRTERHAHNVLIMNARCLIGRKKKE